MKDAGAVGVIDGVADLAAEVERPRQIEDTLPHDDVLERFARHVLHHDEEHIVLLLRGEHGDDVRMVQGGQQPRFFEHLDRVEVLFVRNLERDFLVDPCVFGEIDHTEATAAK